MFIHKCTFLKKALYFSCLLKDIDVYLKSSRTFKMVPKRKTFFKNMFFYVIIFLLCVLF